MVDKSIMAYDFTAYSWDVPHFITSHQHLSPTLQFASLRTCQYTLDPLDLLVWSHGLTNFLMLLFSTLPLQKTAQLIIITIKEVMFIYVWIITSPRKYLSKFWYSYIRVSYLSLLPLFFYYFIFFFTFHGWLSSLMHVSIFLCCFLEHLCYRIQQNLLSERWQF